MQHGFGVLFPEPLLHTQNITHEYTYIHDIERENILYIYMYVIDFIEDFCSWNSPDMAIPAITWQTQRQNPPTKCKEPLTMQKSNDVAVTVLTGGSVTFQFELPWPSKDLSPNARHHWSTAAKAKKAYRTRCRQLGEGVGLGSAPKAFKAVLIHLTFVPPDKRRRDLDNLLASMKAGLDGVADAMGIDDSKWKLAIEMADDPVEGGRVLVEVEVVQ